MDSNVKEQTTYTVKASFWSEDADNWIEVMIDRNSDDQPFKTLAEAKDFIAELKEETDVRWAEYVKVTSTPIETVVFV